MKMKPHVDEHIDRKSTTKEIRPLAWALPLIALLLLQPNQAVAQTFPAISVSEQEITIPGDGVPVVINDIALTSAALPAGFNTCLVTLNTELATSEGQQLAVLFYASGANPTPEMCSLEAVSGPILTQVNGGIDETHTFIGRATFFVHQSQTGAKATIRPCMSSALGGAYRLRIHLMTLQCGANSPALGAGLNSKQVIDLGVSP